MPRRSFILIAVILLVSNLASASTFCACCAEPGTYHISTGRPQKYQLELLKEIDFDKGTMLYMTEAGFDTIKGLLGFEKDFDDPSWDASPGDLDLVNSFTGKAWTFAMTSPTKKTGKLVLPIPSQMLTFKVDIHDGQPSDGGGPLLYKEFRFKGTVLSGTGFFAAGIVKPTSYLLVFQGRGNGCDNVEDFNNWNLEITGAKARYQFFGKLSSGSSYEAEKPKVNE